MLARRSWARWPLKQENAMGSGTLTGAGWVVDEIEGSLAHLATDPLTGKATGLTDPSGGVGFSFVGGLQTGAAYATSNTTSLRSVFAAGGTIRIDTPGTYLINGTLLAPSNTQIILSQGVSLKLDTAANCNLLRNKHAGVTITAGVFVRASNVVTVTEAGHPRLVGDKVFVKNLATDTSFNGLQTITAVTTGSWSYASSGSNGSPTGYGYVTPADIQLTAANFVRTTNVVTVTETGHSRLVGDSVYIDNLATDTSFNGTYQVFASTPGVSWTYASAGSNGSPTGTAVVAGDNNITLTGGTWDGSTSTQSTGSAFYFSVSACFGIVLGNVGHINIQNISNINQTKYAYWIYNSSDVLVDNVYLNTPSDGVHFEGPGDRLSVSRLFGNTSDDMTALTNTSGLSGGSYLGFASPSGLGNFGVCEVAGLFPSNSNAPALVKVTGDASTSLKYLGINGLNGTMNPAATGGCLAIVDDTASLTGMAIGEIILRNVYVTGNSYICRTANTGVTGKLRIENPYWETSSISTFGVLIQAATTNLRKLEVIGWKNPTNLTSSQRGIHVQGTVQDILIDGFEFNSNTTGGLLELNAGTCNDVKVMNGTARGASNLGYCVAMNTTFSLNRLFLSNITCIGNDGIFRQLTATCPVTEILIDNVYLDTCGNGMNPTTSMTVTANNFRANALANNLFQVNSGTIRLNLKNCAAPAGKIALFNFGGSVISMTNSDAAAGFDMGNPAVTKTGEAPLAGDLHWNTNATTAGLYGYTLAGAWAKLF
jgi:hypothetical protein